MPNLDLSILQSLAQPVPTGPRIKNIIGKTFERLTPLGFLGTKRGDSFWLCQCSCGNLTITRRSGLIKGQTRSCGCLNRETSVAAGLLRRKDIVGERFGRLLVTAFSHRHMQPSGNSSLAYWMCLCDCDNQKVISGQSLRKGLTQSCGCYMREQTSKKNFKHGASRKTHPHHYLCTLWLGIRRRCYDPTDEAYARYGGSGIIMDQAWKDDSVAFINYVLTTLGERPTKTHSFDRINGPKGYIIGNVKWSTPDEQNRNKSNNIIITADGRTQCLTDWARERQRSVGTIKSRYEKRGWTKENAVTSNVKDQNQ